jgi:hypothetical protein
MKTFAKAPTTTTTTTTVKCKNPVKGATSKFHLPVAAFPPAGSRLIYKENGAITASAAREKSCILKSDRQIASLASVHNCD